MRFCSPLADKNVQFYYINLVIIHPPNLTELIVELTQKYDEIYIREQDIHIHTCMFLKYIKYYI